MRFRYVAGLLVLFCWYLPVYAQPAPGDGPPPDFQEMRRRMAERMKELLQVNDQQWEQLQAQIQKIHELQRDAGEGPPRPPGPPSGPPPDNGEGGPPRPPPGERGFGPGDDRQPSEVQERMRDLQSALDADAKPDEIKAKLEALREARAEAKRKLTAAQEELRKMATVRQEAVLVDIGLLE